MAADNSTSALARKLAVSRGGAGSGDRSALRALRLSLARAADDLFGLPLNVIGVTQQRCKVENLPAHVAPDRLLMLLDGPDGPAGAAMLDRRCVASLIQHQTMGQVTGGETGDRDFTGTDAALAAPLIDATLKRAAALAETSADRRCLDGYRFGARAEDRRSLLLVLDADRYRVFDLTVEFSGGAQQGTVCLLLPDLPDPDAANPGPGAAAGDRHRMDRTFGAVRAELLAVICRLRLPLHEFSRMRPGDTLPLMRERLGETELVAKDGQTIAVGRLGQVGGMRALRVNETTPLVPAPGGSESSRSFQAGSQGVDPQDAATVDGHVVPAAAPEDIAREPTAGLPALAGTHGDGPDDPGEALRSMSPEEAAVEISELAGLPAPGEDQAETPKAELIG